MKKKPIAEKRKEKKYLLDKRNVFRGKQRKKKNISFIEIRGREEK